MPLDNAGNPLKVGDRVTVVFVVEDILGDTEADVADLKLHLPQSYRDKDKYPTIVLSSEQCYLLKES